ncbi:hypothetical protein T08_16351, partial [Trichinella sp. T8]
LITFCIHDALQLLKINTCAFYSSIFPVRLQVSAFRLFPGAYLVSFCTIFHLLRGYNVTDVLCSIIYFENNSHS